MPNLPSKPLSAVAEAGLLLLASGAEVARVEDTMTRLGRAFGLEVEAMVLPTMVLATAENEMVMRRVRTRRTNLAVLELVNQWSREAAAGALSLEELLRRLPGARTAHRYPAWYEAAAAGVAAAALALLFGGTWATLPWAFAAGLVAQGIRLAIKARSQVGILADMAAASGTVLPALAAAQLPGTHPALVLVGGIMVLVPGVLLTTGVRDGMAGDLLSSLARLLEAALISAAVAGGASLVLFVYVHLGGRWP
jgi:uncharacterized membrane protein YjjP (DUF1212 family)